MTEAGRERTIPNSTFANAEPMNLEAVAFGTAIRIVQAFQALRRPHKLLPSCTAVICVQYV